MNQDLYFFDDPETPSYLRNSQEAEPQKIPITSTPELKQSDTVSNKPVELTAREIMKNNHEKVKEEIQDEVNKQLLIIREKVREYAKNLSFGRSLTVDVNIELDPIVYINLHDIRLYWSYCEPSSPYQSYRKLHFLNAISDLLHSEGFSFLHARSNLHTFIISLD